MTPDLIKDFTVNSVTYYSVPPLFLQEVAQLYLAMYQVLEAFQTFLEEGDRQPFTFDPGWKMLRMLAWHTNKKDILIAFVVLRRRCEVCNSHIKEYFNAMRKMFLQTDEQESVSTMYSTRPSVRSQFGHGSVHEKVGKLLLRPDYNSCIPVAYRNGISRLTEAAVTAANKMHEKIPTEFYKDTHARIHEIQPTGVITAARSASNASYKVRALDHAFTKTSQVAYTNTNSQSNRAFSQYAPSTTHTMATQSVKVPMPASISVIAHRRHAISTMPGMGRIEVPASDIAATAPVSTMGVEQRNEPAAKPSQTVAFAGRQTPPHLSTKFLEQPPHVPASNPPSHWTSYQFKDNHPIPSPSDEDLRSPGDPPPGGDPPDDDSGGGGPGGGGPNSSPGGTPGGPPGGPPNGPPGGGGDPSSGWVGQPYSPFPYSDEWQLNNKLNSSVVPSWDGHGSTAIEYISSMSFLARMSQKMKEGVAAMAPYKWSGRAKSWWECLPLTDQTYFRQDWEHMMIGLRIQFLDLRWSRERLYEFEGMFFRQKGHANEDPIDFIQRRVRHHMFLHPDDLDGPGAVDRILRNQPIEWEKDLNDVNCPSIFALQSAASRLATSLINDWQSSEIRARNTAANQGDKPSIAGKGCYGRTAHVASLDSLPESPALIQAEDDASSGDEGAEAFAATFNKRTNKSGTASSSKWPKGKVMNGVSFPRDDSVKSDKAPNGTCYICTSPYHFARDCPHYGKWDSLHSANLISVDLDHEVEAASDREYLAMLAEIKAEATSSAYAAEIAKISKEAFCMSADLTGAKALHAKNTFMNDNRNIRRRVANEHKGKERERLTEDSSDIKPLTRAKRRLKGSAEPSPPEMERGEIFVAPKGRSFPEGLGSLGTRALHT